MVITIYLGDNPNGYQGRHLLMIGFSIDKLEDEGFDGVFDVLE
jgi:hypothetical protein